MKFDKIQREKDIRFVSGLFSVFAWAVGGIIVGGCVVAWFILNK
jgi:hypothetical protein